MKPGKVLIITVGGSCEPIVLSINANKPNYIYFICSDDGPASKGSYVTVINEGYPCKGNPVRNIPDKKNILQQSVFPSKNTSIHKISDPDDFNICFEECVKIIELASKTFPDHPIAIDYTGGTKSMSAGLVAAASLTQDIEINLVTGIREDLVKVKEGTSHLHKSKKNLFYLNNYLNKIDHLISHYQYAGAIDLLTNILDEIPDLPSNFEASIKHILQSAKTFDHWDKFQHQSALDILSASHLKKKYLPYFLKLKNIIKNIENDKPSGYELVADLIWNARRKAKNNLWDDAVARLYRAMECYIQVRLLKQYGIFTSDIDINRIPNGIYKETLENKKADGSKIQTGLYESFTLLQALKDNDPCSVLFSQKSSSILNILKIRNQSILAHGFRAINHEDYHDFSRTIIDEFIGPLLKAEGIDLNDFSNQLPTRLFN
jgi:CRISPR-associated protein (TIGR02710 family)